MVPQQTEGLFNWSTRLVCREGGRGGMGDGGRGAGLKDGRRETPSFSSVSSAEANTTTASLRGTEAARKLQEAGNQFGVKHVL